MCVRERGREREREMEKGGEQQEKDVGKKQRAGAREPGGRGKGGQGNLSGLGV